MWLNDKEKQIFGPFIEYIEANEERKFKFVYGDGSELIVELDTQYESDNGLELEDKEYEEYWEAAFKILEVLKDDNNVYSSGDFILVNYHNIPISYQVV